MRTAHCLAILLGLLPASTLAGEASGPEAWKVLELDLSRVWNLEDHRGGFDDGFGLGGRLLFARGKDHAIGLGVTHHRLSAAGPDGERLLRTATDFLAQFRLEFPAARPWSLAFLGGPGLSITTRDFSRAAQEQNDLIPDTEADSGLVIHLSMDLSYRRVPGRPAPRIFTAYSYRDSLALISAGVGLAY